MLLIADDNNRDVISASRNIDLAVLSDSQNKLSAKLGELNDKLNIAMRKGNHLKITDQSQLPPHIRKLKSEIQRVQDEISRLDVQRRQMCGNSNEVRQSYASDPKPKTLGSSEEAEDQSKVEEEDEFLTASDAEAVNDEEFNAF